MIVATCVLAAILGAADGSDPKTLVEQLGAPRYSERESASEALRALGRGALPALRAAKNAEDLEVRTRARMLIDEIESNLMVQPTMVRLDFRDRPVSEVVKNLSDQADVQLNLLPENIPIWNVRRVTLEKDQPVPFWQAIDLLCRTVSLDVNPGIQMVGVGQPTRQAVVNLVAIDDEPTPASNNGPFRVQVFSIQHHRDRSFSHAQIGAALVLNQNGGLVQPPGPVAEPRKAEGRRVAGVRSEMFSVVLQFLSEPRMSATPSGSIKLTEAVDEKGRSLLPPSNGNGAIQRYSAYNGFNPTGTAIFQQPIALELPSGEPGQWIKRLRGSLPVTVMSRKEDPAIISLADAKGKPLEVPGMTLQVHGIQPEPNQAQFSIDLTVKMTNTPADDAQRGPFGAEFIAFRHAAGGAQNQIEITDSEGHFYPQWFTINPQPGTDGTRMTLRLMTAPNLGPPAQIRYYEISRAQTEIAFEIDDIPMP